MKILIVCSSNTCRSPYAEFIFKRLVSESDVLKKNIESVTSSAVFNQSRAMHPKTYALLLEEGFTKEELDAFKPDFILKDRKKFDEADVIIGMGYLQWFLLPFKYKKKYVNLSKAAIGKTSTFPIRFTESRWNFTKIRWTSSRLISSFMPKNLKKNFQKKIKRAF